MLKLGSDHNIDLNTVPIVNIFSCSRKSVPLKNNLLLSLSLPLLF